jgi:hypothetical protein
MFDLIIALLAIIFGVVALFGQDAFWNLMGSAGGVEDVAKTRMEWEKNLKYSGGASLLLGGALLVLLVIG